MAGQPPADPFEIAPLPLFRRVTADFLTLAQRRHMIHGLIVVDVTDARRLIREHRARSGESLSFTAFIVACLARAVDEHRSLHAMRQGRHLVLFDEVDVTTLVEREVAGQRSGTPHIVRAANRKSFGAIHREIRAAQVEPAAASREIGPLLRAARLANWLPAPARLALLSLISRSPTRMKRLTGTVAVTALGMFAGGASWGIPLTNFTLCVTVGGIVEHPRLMDGQLSNREALCLTISVDHDIVDGAPAARFAARFKALIESGYGLAEVIQPQPDR